MSFLSKGVTLTSQFNSAFQGPIDGRYVIVNSEEYQELVDRGLYAGLTFVVTTDVEDVDGNTVEAGFYRVDLDGATITNVSNGGGYVVTNYYEYKNLLSDSIYPGLTFAVTQDLMVAMGYYKVLSDTTKYEHQNINQYRTNIFRLTTDLTNSDGVTIVASGVYRMTDSNTIVSRSVNTISNVSDYLSFKESADDHKSAAADKVIYIPNDLVNGDTTLINAGYYYTWDDTSKYVIESIPEYTSIYEPGSVVVTGNGLTVDGTVCLTTGTYLMSDDGTKIQLVEVEYISSTADLVSFMNTANANSVFFISMELTDTNIKAGFYIIDRNNNAINVTDTNAIGLSCKGISIAPTDKGTSYPVSITTEFKIGNVTFPKYAKGMFIGAADDAVLYVVDSSGNLYTAYRNGITWQSPKMISNSGGSTNTNVTLESLGISVTAKEIDYLDNATSNIQNQINAINQQLLQKAPSYQASTVDLTAGTSTLATGTLYFVYE